MTLHTTPSPILPLTHVKKKASACAGHTNYIRSLEHVQVQLSLSYSRRGDLEISLTSPMGTCSTLVAIRCGGWGTSSCGSAQGGTSTLWGQVQPIPHGSQSRGQHLALQSDACCTSLAPLLLVEKPPFCPTPTCPSQTLRHQRPRLQQLDLHVYPLLG